MQPGGSGSQSEAIPGPSSNAPEQSTRGQGISEDGRVRYDERQQAFALRGQFNILETESDMLMRVIRVINEEIDDRIEAISSFQRDIYHIDKKMDEIEKYIADTGDQTRYRRRYEELGGNKCTIEDKMSADREKLKVFRSVLQNGQNQINAGLERLLLLPRLGVPPPRPDDYNYTQRIDGNDFRADSQTEPQGSVRD